VEDHLAQLAVDRGLARADPGADGKGDIRKLVDIGRLNKGR
jgi:hypothetical protein